jgi:hypothetical protein
MNNIDTNSIASASAQARSLGGCSWYWIDKTILFDHGSALKASGIAVYNVLAAFSNGKTQTCYPTHGRIAHICGLSNRSVIRKIKLLEQLGLIAIERNGKARTYRLLAHRIRDKTYPASDKSNHRYVTKIHANDNKETKMKNDNPMMNFENVKPRTKAELLAHDLAIALRDHGGYQFYLAAANVYPENVLRAIASQVNQIPDKNIKKSRGALFNHLLKKYAQQANNNFRH